MGLQCSVHVPSLEQGISAHHYVLRNKTLLQGIETLVTASVSVVAFDVLGSARIRAKAKNWGGGEKRRKRLPAETWILQNAFAHKREHLIGAVFISLNIDSCQLNVRKGVNMVDSTGDEFDRCLQKALDILAERGFKLSLKEGQKTSIRKLWIGDLLAVRPTGFGKSLIFQLLVPEKKVGFALVICLS